MAGNSPHACACVAQTKEAVLAVEKHVHAAGLQGPRVRITLLPVVLCGQYGTSYQLVWINGWPIPLRMSVAAPVHLSKRECLLSNLHPNTHVQIKGGPGTGSK